MHTSAVVALAAIVLGLASPSGDAAELRDGVLVVRAPGGVVRPFFPLGSWATWDYTTPEDLARLGMNTMFRGAPGGDSARVEEFRTYMRELNVLGIHLLAHFRYGGLSDVNPWPDQWRQSARALASEPNLLSWYIGDDVQNWHLPGIRHAAGVLHDETPNIPVAAAYVGRQRTAEAETVFSHDVDIPVQWKYPIPESTFTYYRGFFFEQRHLFGDPIFTWIQNFMWDRTADYLKLGKGGPGPLPEPEQLRLMSYAAITSGVRGLLYFSHHDFHRMPELASEVALICREVRMFTDHLAAGDRVFGLTTSDTSVVATAFRYGGSVVVAAAVFRPFYHRWVDEGVVAAVTIDVPWSGQSLPQALLLHMPDVLPCAVARSPRPDMVSVTIPSLEVAGMLLVSSDPAELAHMASTASAATDSLRRFALAGAVAQSRKVSGTVWQLGYDSINLPESPVMMPMMRAVERCADATAEGRSADAVRSWREALRLCRVMIDSTMRFAESRRHVVPDTRAHQHYLQSLYGLHNLDGIMECPGEGDPWHFVQEWLVVGPFPLGWDQFRRDLMPDGFLRPYQPETDSEPDAVFETLDGPRRWSRAEADLSGKLNLLEYFETTDDVVGYARCRVTAPRGMDVTISAGSNDGCRIWVNGELVFSDEGVRSATPHMYDVPARLNAGPNDLLVKVENTVVNWHLYLSVYDPERELVYEAR